MNTKYITLMICTLTAALLFAGCASSVNEGAAVRHRESTAESSEEEEKEEISVSSSSVSSPAGLDKWISVSKYSTVKKKYYDLPLRVNSVTRGKDAADRVRKYMETDSALTYRQPKKGYEWVVLSYDVSLDDFPMDESGADASVQSFLLGADGGDMEYSGSLYSDVTVNMTDGNYYFEGIHGGETAFILPVKLRDYLVSFGEYGESAGYFSETA